VPPAEYALRIDAQLNRAHVKEAQRRVSWATADVAAVERTLARGGVTASVGAENFFSSVSAALATTQEAAAS
jgi:hypothetical protein